MLVRKFEFILFLDQLTVHPDGEFPDFTAGINVDRNPGFTRYKRRHTGGEHPVVESDLAVSNGHVFHQMLLFI